MKWGERHLVSWILQIMILYSVVHGSRGPPKFPSNAAAMPVSAPPNEVPSNLFPVNQSHLKGSPVVSPASHGVENPSESTHPPSTSELSPAMVPAAHEVTNASNTAKPLTPHSVSSPPASLAPSEAKDPSIAAPSSWSSRSSPSPLKNPFPNEAKNSSSITPAPSTSHPSLVITPSAQDQNPSNVVPAPVMSHLGSPPSTGPLPHEIRNPLNVPAPMTSHSSPVVNPVPRGGKNPSNTSLGPNSHPSVHPVVSPTPNELKNPTTPTAAPSTSFPMISPLPHQIENPSNIPPSPSTPYRSSSPMISPVSPEAKNPPNATLGPSTPNSSPPPVISPVPHEIKNPSTPTAAPISFPVMSPPHQSKNPSNIPPVPSTPHPSSSPMISPLPHEAKNPSNATVGPSTSNSLLPPVISPAPHETKNPSTPTAAPSTSFPVTSPPNHSEHPSNISPIPSSPYPSSSPMISRVPHEARNPSNATLGPSTSNSSPSPVTSPMPHEIKNPLTPTVAPSNSFPATSPPHQSENPSNIPPAPSTAYPSSPPVTSPTPHEVKNPPNATLAPSTSNSSLPPAISSVPHGIKNPSTPTTAPSTSFSVTSPPHQRENPSNVPPVPSIPYPSFPPMISPVPHEAKNPSNATLGPSSSNSSLPPEISPAPHEMKNPSNPATAPSISSVHHQSESPSDTPPTPSTSYPSSSPMVSPELNGAKNHSNTKHAPLTSEPGFTPVSSPEPHRAKHSPDVQYAPVASHPQPPAPSTFQIPAPAPMTPMHHHTTNRSVVNHSAAPSMPPSPSHQSVQSPVASEAPLHPPEYPKHMPRHAAPPVYLRGPSLSPIQAPYSSNRAGIPAPSPSSMIPSRRNQGPAHSPILPPLGSSTRGPIAPLPVQIWAPPTSSGPVYSPKHSPTGSVSRRPDAPAPLPIWRLPSPPPNYDCNSLQCSAPLANSPPGSPCSCVLPIKVGLRLGVALYTFFPLVSELAQEIASGVFLKQSQVRIMGANAASEDSEKTTVLIDLVPLGKYFDNNTAFLIYERFWNKQVVIEASFFGDYDVLYVIYQGLPPSPPVAPSDISVGNGVYGNVNNGRTIHPLGVDVRKRKEKVSGSLIAIFVLSSVIALVFIIGAAWLVVLKNRNQAHLSSSIRQPSLPTFAKASGTEPIIIGSGPSSTSASASSSILTYAGSVKTFTLAEIEKATKRFDDSRIIGEGGFGRVYEGTLEDGTRVAVKALKRDDQQGGREFLAEVEMLGRLHHRNLVKLIGICTEETRCLVYELIPNGSVESHLHGVDKQTAPLDWGARVKIALGAARALAYLHEDSSPRVIHRDFKSSNILLEHDFTPKVSDFGLARTAMEGGNEPVSTRVMGTFGYVAPEYAMTGHLLVKSDVYSYGVVLLELLTGRKPVDMMQPPGQENLVTWARPLLTSTDGLITIIDRAIGSDVQLDSLTKVAAIASMCVQPEVSHRPFMGEVVQALKLVCNENDGNMVSESCCSQEELSDREKGVKAERMLSPFDTFSSSPRLGSDSFRRCSSSGPVEAGTGRQFMQGVRGLSTGSMSEHGVALRYARESESHEQWT